MTDTTAAAPPPEDMLQIPPNVYVGCPLLPGKLVGLARCPGCQHFAGLADRFGDGSTQPFAVRYLLRCGCPRNLPIVEVQT